MAFLALVGCSHSGSLQLMGEQPRYGPLQPSTFFGDGQSERPPVPDTVARGRLQDDALLNTGMVEGQPAPQFPYAVTREVLGRGHERFDIYCAPCHGRAGDGQGVVVQRGFPQPPSFHDDRLRAAPPGQLFDVITHGQGKMPPYSDQVPVRDRWAVVAYIRALQLSQHATLDDVPAEERGSVGAKQ